MAFLKTLGLLFPLLLSSSVWADTIKIKADHPDQYIVVKGDTLWDIAGNFLENPWQWPQLWQHNPQIKDPHLIYPADILYFSMVNGQPRLSLTRNVQLSPKVRTTYLDKSIQLIPTDAIAQFLTSPKVVNSTELGNSPYVIDFAGEHLIAGAGDRVYVRSINHPKTLSYTIYRAGETYRDPDTKEILGYEAKFIADTTIDHAGDPATLTITKADSEIRRGDRLMINSNSELSLNFFPTIPKTMIEASIISVLDGVSQIGQFNIVVLNKGLSDGLKVGHTLDIYHNGKTVKDPFSTQKDATIKLPNELSGILMVFRSFERVSYALVMEAYQAIHLLDKVQTP